MIPPPESAESRARWREALDQYLARRQRIATLRAELAAARTAGLAARHAAKLRRERAGEPTTEDTDQ